LADCRRSSKPAEAPDEYQAGEVKVALPRRSDRTVASRCGIAGVCQRHDEEKAWAVARSKGPAPQRMARLFLEILANLLMEHRVNEIVVFAIEHMWVTVRAHKDVTRNIVELIVRDGVEAGEFESIDPRETAEVMMRSMVAFCHPMMVSQCLEEDTFCRRDPQKIRAVRGKAERASI
jgi:hypothetical protein